MRFAVDKWKPSPSVKRKTAIKARMVPLVVRLSQYAGFWELQIPIHTEAQNANGNYFRSKTQARMQLDTTMAVLQAHLRGIDRAAISGIELTRISPGRLDAHDNLPQAFKHVLDAVCAWIVRGDEFCDADRRRIGKFDDQLLTTGKVTCQYAQETHSEDRRMQGIRIRLLMR